MSMCAIRRKALSLTISLGALAALIVETAPRIKI